MVKIVKLVKLAGPCGVQEDLYGFHRLNCKRGAGPAFKSGHNTVQDQLAYELRRLNLSVVSQDAKLRQQFSHLTSKKRGDLAVDAESTISPPHSWTDTA